MNQLLHDYNAKLARYRKMEEWEKVASFDDRMKQEKNIKKVINDCNDALNKILEHRCVTADEIVNGFQV